MNKSMLLKILQILKDLKMVLRAGINEVTFIHWMYTAQWIIPTYNIKRLERVN